MKLSIIIIVRNEELRIRECLIRVIRQIENKSVEIVIVDGASSDKTVEVIESLQEKRIRIIRCTSYGYSYQRNIGARNAKGEHLLYLSGDTYISNRLIDKYYRELKSADIIQGTINNIPNERPSSIEVCKVLPLIYRKHLKNQYENFSTVNVCIRRDLLLDRPFNEHLDSLEDKEWFFGNHVMIRYKRLKTAVVHHDVHENLTQYGKKIYKEAEAMGEILKKKNTNFRRMNFFNWLIYFYSYLFLISVTMFMFFFGHLMFFGTATCIFLSGLYGVLRSKHKISLKVFFIYLFYTFLVFCGILAGLLRRRDIYEDLSSSGSS